MGPGPDNVLSAFIEHARAAPGQDALLLTAPGDVRVTERATYGELLARAESFAAGLSREKLHHRRSVIVAGPLSVDFYALAIAIVGSGSQLVLIDGRLDRRRLLSALRTARAGAIVSVPEALRRWPVVPPLWRARRYAVEGTAGFGVRPIAQLSSQGRAELAPGGPEEAAIVSFTSGSTGRAKGVVRTNAILLAQHLSLSANLPFLPGDVDMTCFPAVVLHNLACGVTTVLPPVDLRTPASIDPAAALGVIRETGVTTLSGAPAFIQRIARHVSAEAPPPPLTRIVLGGAPVSRALCRELATAFPDAQTVIVYGSTEAEPIAHTHGRDVLAEPAGPAGDPAGLLVGAPVAGVAVRIVTLPERLEQPVTREWLEARTSELGEVIVAGANVSRTYVGDDEAVLRNKVRLADGTVWHRTGDLARLDDAGRLRLLGRVGDAVRHEGRWLHPLPLEAQLSGLPGVRRAALVGLPSGPALAVSLEDGATPDAIVTRIGQLGLHGIAVRVVAEIPVDARHQSKIDRPALRLLLANG
jgi:acyl-CoA synthetase (AMP-forming)/AMP-acid ligase II